MILLLSDRPPYIAITSFPLPTVRGSCLVGQFRNQLLTGEYVRGESGESVRGESGESATGTCGESTFCESVRTEL